MNLVNFFFCMFKNQPIFSYGMFAITKKGMKTSVADPDPDFFGPPRSGSIVRGMDPDPALDPDPSIIKQIKFNIVRKTLISSVLRLLFEMM